ncbi:leucine rich repeat [Chlorella sorokiniana]|uniref:Leucine rich repeat n=1 Tax=Chlorella sorokiniana TaxID=3076 RepID=A0A2P6U2R0_CHLSO|nr:leucine rich repeat [Chlorella sorokiniana]|eukprot:PRW60592.1 leucine rich repeat [Chlorella sorokiniana]
MLCACRFAARDPSTRRAIELQLPSDPPLPLQELCYHQLVAPPHLVQAVLQRCPPSLAALSLAESSFCDIPAAVRSISCLQRLDLSYNRFEDLRPLACLTTLTSLSLERVGLRDVPPELSRLTALRSLSLRHNPEIRGSWAPLAALQGSLTRLDTSGTGLAGTAHLPDELTTLSGLRWLDASSNGVRSWRQLAALQRLTHLALRSCQLSELPAEALAATGLRSLNLSRNERLSEDGLGRLSALRSLTCLDLSACFVSRLPPSLSALTSLQQLLLAAFELL